MRFWAVAAATLAADQLAKFLVSYFLSEGASMPVVDGILYFTYVKNPGAAFGLFPNRTVFFVLVTVLVMIMLVVFHRRYGNRAGRIEYALALQLGGAIGNLVDRVRLGYVIDFFDFRFWPIFNLADVAIVAGVALLGLAILFLPEADSERGWQ